jgi:hypothetical protein
MKRYALSLTLALVVGSLMVTVSAEAAFVSTSGKVNLIRVQDVGQLYGAPGDVIDVDVIFTLTTSPGKAFGFQLRTGTNQLTREGMLNLLRDAFNNNWTVIVEYNIEPGKNNGVASRVFVVR